MEKWDYLTILYKKYDFSEYISAEEWDLQVENVKKYNNSKLILASKCNSPDEKFK